MVDSPREQPFCGKIDPKPFGDTRKIELCLAMAPCLQGRRIEFFDPKTRPMALFWDPEALATMPVSQLRTSAAALFWRVALDMGYVRATPLSVINRRGMFTLIRDAIRRIDDEHNDRDLSARMDMCVATFLQNREGDDGGARVPNWAGRFGYPTH